MSENLVPTGLGTVTTPEYSKLQVAARRRQARGSLSRFEMLGLALVVAIVAVPAFVAAYLMFF